MDITKVIIPVAGLGTRFLPVTKSIPKAMIPIFDTPSIHYAVKEAMIAGMKEVIIVMSRGQEAIIEYFNNSLKSDRNSNSNQKMDEISYINNNVSINIVYQDNPRGLGDAILQCKDIINGEPFGVILPDDLILGNNSIISEMSKVYTQKKSSVIAIKKVPSILLPNLGVVDAKRIESKVYEILNMVEKPKIEDAPSDLAIIGRYILPYEIFETLEKTNLGINGEIQLTDAIDSLIKDIGVLGYQFPEVHFDVGTPLGLLKASIHQSMKNEEFIDDIKSFFKF